MASFLTSALGGVNNLSNLVDRVNQFKDNIERTLDNAVGHDEEESSSPSPAVPIIATTSSGDKEEDFEPSQETRVIDTTAQSEQVDHIEKRGTREEKEKGESSQQQAEDALGSGDVATPTEGVPERGGTETETSTSELIAESKLVVQAIPDEANVSSSREQELLGSLKRREAQLEKMSRQLAEQEEQLNNLRASLDNASADKRMKAAEARAEGLMKEGLILAEKQGKAEQSLRKVRKEKEEIEAKEKTLTEHLKKEQDVRKALENELNELRDVRKRGEASIAQIAESNADSARRLEEARSQALQAERREQEMKVAMERTFAEVADQKKTITAITQQLNAAKRDAEHAKFQLKEQLDTRQLHGSRAESVEKSLAEAKAALEEHVRESRQLETDLRGQVNRVTEQFRNAEKRAEEAAAKALELTTPLLRQIDQLNEQRSKNEQAASALLTRAVSAEAAEQEATAGKRRAEQARSELAVRVAELESMLTAAKADASRSVSDCKIAIKRAEEAERERDSIQKALDALRSSSDAKVAEQRLTEMKLRQDLALEVEKGERGKRVWEEKSKDIEERHQVELRKLRLQLEPMNQGMAQPMISAVPFSPAPNSSTHHPSSDHPMASPPSANLRRFPSDAASSVVSASHMMMQTQDEILGNVLFGDDFSTGGNHMMEASEGSSSRYLLQTSEMQAGIRRRDAKVRLLSEQLEMVSKQKDDLVGQVQVLHTKLASLESLAEKEAAMSREIAGLHKQNTLLLELVGEKEEQIEALHGDMEDVKEKFREQIQMLLKA